jgi:hypothetical protein
MSAIASTELLMLKHSSKTDQEKPKMATRILSHLNAESLARAAQAEGWKKLVDESNDPLAIWKSLSLSMRTRSAGDLLRALATVRRACITHAQKEGQPLAAYLKETEYLLSSMKSLEIKPEEPEEQKAMSFIDGLDRRRYHTLRVDLMSRPSGMPKTLASTYDTAST